MYTYFVININKTIKHFKMYLLLIFYNVKNAELANFLNLVDTNVYLLLFRIVVSQLQTFNYRFYFVFSCAYNKRETEFFFVSVI